MGDELVSIGVMVRAKISGKLNNRLYNTKNHALAYNRCHSYDLTKEQLNQRFLEHYDLVEVFIKE